MKYAVGGGHSWATPGARGIIDEVTEDRKITAAVIKEMIARSLDVVDCTSDAKGVSNYLKEAIYICNVNGVDLAIQFHLNSGKGTGVEALYHPSSIRGKYYAQLVAGAIAEVTGLDLRGDNGAKPRTDLGFLNGTKMPAIIVEVCFVDNATSVNRYKAAGVEKIAKAIVDVLVDGKVNHSTSTPKQPVEASEVVWLYDQWNGTVPLWDRNNPYSPVADVANGVSVTKLNYDKWDGSEGYLCQVAGGTYWINAAYVWRNRYEWGDKPL